MSVAEKIVSDITKPEKKKIVQPQKMGILVENPVYKPFRYPWCYEAWLTQQRIHGLAEEVPLASSYRNTRTDRMYCSVHSRKLLQDSSESAPI